jgi:hypothetical protein
LFFLRRTRVSSLTDTLLVRSNPIQGDTMLELAASAAEDALVWHLVAASVIAGVASMTMTILLISRLGRLVTMRRLNVIISVFVAAIVLVVARGLLTAGTLS